jgi:hypothetical protein
LNREMIRNSRKTIDGHYQDNFFDAAFKKFIFQFVVRFRRIISSADRVWHLLSTTRRVSLLTTRNTWNTFRKNFNYRNLDANVKLKFQITAQKGKNSIEIRSQINIASRRFLKTLERRHLSDMFNTLTKTLKFHRWRSQWQLSKFI